MTSAEVTQCLAARGIAVEHRRLLDWAHKGLIKRASGGRGRGRARGRDQVWADGTVEQAALVAALMRLYRNADSVRVALWVLGEPIAFRRFHKAFLRHVEWWAWFDGLRQEVSAGAADYEDLADAISRKAVSLAKNRVDAMDFENVLGLFANAKFSLGRDFTAELVSAARKRGGRATAKHFKTVARVLRDDLGASTAYETVVTASEDQWVTARKDWLRLRNSFGAISEALGLNRPDFKEMSLHFAALLGSVMTVVSLLLRKHDRAAWLDDKFTEWEEDVAELLPELVEMKPIVNPIIVPKVLKAVQSSLLPLRLGLPSRSRQKARRRRPKGGPHPGDRPQEVPPRE